MSYYLPELILLVVLGLLSAFAENMAERKIERERRHRTKQLEHYWR